MNTLPVLLLAAAGVGVGHAVMPDHWLPLALLSRTRHYRTGTVARLSLAAAVAHVVVSLLLGGVVIGVGLQFRGTIAGHTDLAVGGILLATGAVFLVLDLRGKGHGHPHPHPHPHGREHAGHGGGTAVLDRRATAAQARGPRGLAALLVPFGAAASPDLTILPVFLAASALGAGAALGSLAVFAIVTVVTIAGLTIATALGARLLTAPWIDRSANRLTAGTLLLIGALVAFGLI
jgi:nickel/cobalt exporter